MSEEMPRESQLRAALAEAVQYLHMLGVEKVPANIYQRWQNLIAAQDAAQYNGGVATLGTLDADAHLDAIGSGVPLTDVVSEEERAAQDRQAL